MMMRRRRRMKAEVTLSCDTQQHGSQQQAVHVADALHESQTLTTIHVDAAPVPFNSAPLPPSKCHAALPPLLHLCTYSPLSLSLFFFKLFDV